MKLEHMFPKYIRRIDRLVEYPRQAEKEDSVYVVQQIKSRIDDNCCDIGNGGIPSRNEIAITRLKVMIRVFTLITQRGMGQILETVVSRKNNVVVMFVSVDGYGKTADGVVNGFDKEALRRCVSTLALAGDVEVFITKDDPCSIKVDPIFVRPKKIGTIREQAVAPCFFRAR